MSSSYVSDVIIRQVNIAGSHHVGWHFKSPLEIATKKRGQVSSINKGHLIMRPNLSLWRRQTTGSLQFMITDVVSFIKNKKMPVDFLKPTMLA